MPNQHNPTATEHLNKLIQFRQAAYYELGHARDALFELTDAVLQMRQVQSFAELACAPLFRRKWSSVYEAIQDGTLSRAGLLKLYLQLNPAPARPLLAGDHTAWPRLWAEKLVGRSFQHQPTPIPGHRPVTIGHGYSTLALIPEEHGSWALPLLHEHIPDQKPIRLASQQLRTVCAQLPGRPITLWDSEYGGATFLKETATVPADKIIRLRTNLGLEGLPKPYGGKGRKPVHGSKFKLADPSTWWDPDETFELTDVEAGPIRVRLWKNLRFKQALSCWMQVVQIERPLAPGTRRKPKLLWMAWVGAEAPPRWWQLYRHRYPIDHWYRFAKGRLHWTLPRLATPEQSECWSDLMPLITWELWLARSVATDNPLPWQKAHAPLSPGRTSQAMQAILAAIGTPAAEPKPRGKAPGWPKGRVRARRERVSIIRSERWKTIRRQQKAKKSRVNV